MKASAVSNKEHTKSYSMIGFQCAYLATKFPSIFWDCACLIVDSGVRADDSTNYAKTAKAIGKMINQGISFSLLDINKSGFYFEPDEAHNTILYGLKSLNRASPDTIEEIIANRPYSSFQDFLDKVNSNRLMTISLIKGGAFNEFGSPEEIMEEYIGQLSNPKKRLTMQNFNGLITAGLVPPELKLQRQVFNFNKGLKKECGYNKDYFMLDKNKIYYKFYMEFLDDSYLVPKDNHILLPKVDMKKQYDEIMIAAKEYISNNQETLLAKFNQSLFDELWEQYAAGNISSWEIEALGMYYHDHELSGLNEQMYGIKHFDDLPYEPVPEKFFKKGGKKIPLFGTCRICGTVIAKDDARSSISLLTKDSGVVTCKMNREYYAKYNRQISEVDAEGVKHVIEASWFKKGTLVIVNGYRREDTFMMRRKAQKGKVLSHQLYKIYKIHDNGTVDMTNSRYGDEE